MSWHKARHFFLVFDHLLKVIIMMTSYMLLPYCIIWEERRKNTFETFIKDSHHDMQVMSQRNVKNYFI